MGFYPIGVLFCDQKSTRKVALRKRIDPSGAEILFCRRGGFYIRPRDCAAVAGLHGRAMLAPTATARLRVGGGVPDAPSNARALRADMESAPTAYTKISIGPYKVGNRVYLAPEGSNGEK